MSTRFISELDLLDPADQHEMNKHVFGANYEKDRNGNPIDRWPLSEWSLRNGKTGFDRIAQHIKAIRRFGRKGDNPNLPNDQRNLAADEELARIQAIQRSAGQPVFKE